MQAKRFFILLLIIFYFAGHVIWAQPGATPRALPDYSTAVKTGLGFNAGSTFHKEKGMGHAFAFTKNAVFSISFGKPLGFIISSRLLWQDPSNYTELWYRYRGFFGLSLAGGLESSIGPFDLSLSAGGILARYNLSYSYLWFPFLEAGLALPIFEFGEGLSLNGSIALPVYLRKDVASFAASLGLKLEYKSKAWRQP
ncbi:hypothetical protein MASR2M29_21080 [Spirochaetota bacterium]